MLTGVLHVTSVDPVSGEEIATGELAIQGARAALPFRSMRGESVQTRAKQLADRIATQVRAIDAEHGHPVRVRFDVVDDAEALVSVEPLALSPAALVRTLVERVRHARLARDLALARITPLELESSGMFVLEHAALAPYARGLAASPGAAAGRLALPADFDTAAGDARVLVIDDAAPEDAIAIRAAAAIIATSGGLTADAAIAARALRKPCVVSAPVRLGDRNQPARGDWVTVDGSTGEIHVGALPTRWAPSTPFAAELVSWLDPGPAERPADALIRWRNAAAQGRPA